MHAKNSGPVMAGVVEKKKPTIEKAIVILQAIFGFVCWFLVALRLISPLPVLVGASAFTGFLFLVFAYGLWRNKGWVEGVWFGWLVWFCNLALIIGSTFNIDFVPTFGMLWLFIAIGLLGTFGFFPDTRTTARSLWGRWINRPRCKGCGARILESERSEYERNEGYCYSCFWDEVGLGWKKPISSPSGARAAHLLDTAHKNRLRYELNKLYMHQICPKCTRPLSYESGFETGSPLCPDCGTQLWFECPTCEAEIAICDEFCWYCGAQNPNYNARSHSK